MLGLLRCHGRSSHVLLVSGLLWNMPSSIQRAAPGQSEPIKAENPCVDGTAACELTREQWIESMVNRYERPLLAYASRLFGGDGTLAQDAVQETFLRLCREDREAIESRVAAWLFFSLSNACDRHSPSSGKKHEIVRRHAGRRSHTGCGVDRRRI